MELVQAGNKDAFGTLFARYRGPVWSWLARRTRDRELSAELYQEAFLRIWRSSHTYRKGQPVKPWVYKIAGNVARDRFRREQRRVDTVEIDTDRTGERYDPLSGMDLENAIGKLPDTLREAFLLGAVQGLDHNEVAQALDISPANARRRISRARAQLRELLAEQGVVR
jgi:RNA polymerase sigma-70 factor (ECF subfamily)